MKKRMSWCWALPAVAGVALIVVAALLSSSSPGSPGVPAANAVDNVGEYCVLQIVKQADESEVEAGDRITYTITVTNVATAPGVNVAEGCVNPEITDVLSQDLECVSASVIENEDSLTFSQAAIDGSCQADDVDWAFGGSLKEGDQVVVRLRVETDEGLDEGDHVLNEACVTADVVEGAGLTTEGIVMKPQCDTETVRIRERQREREPTATPTVAPTNTPRPPLPTSTPLPPLPTAKPLATLTGPLTGTGSDGHASWPLALGLGLGGVCLVVVSGTALARKRIR